MSSKYHECVCEVSKQQHTLYLSKDLACKCLTEILITKRGIIQSKFNSGRLDMVYKVIWWL